MPTWGAGRVVRKERGAKKKVQDRYPQQRAYSLRQFDFASGLGISRQAPEVEIIECRWIAKRVPHQGRDSRRNGYQLRSRLPQAEKASLKWLLIQRQSEEALMWRSTGL